jgi:hypothetical protein
VTRSEEVEFSQTTGKMERAAAIALRLSGEMEANREEIADATREFREAGYKLKLIANKHRQHEDVKKAVRTWEASRSEMRSAGIDIP